MSEQVPGTLKGVQGILITVGVGVAGWLLYRNWKKQQDLKKANQAADIAASDLQQLAAQGVYPSYNGSQYETFSIALQEAMNGCGTDEDSIYQVFRQMQNKADVLALIKQFGVRYYQPCWITQADAYAIWMFNDQAYGGNLNTWLSYDLNSSEIGQINSILQQKGIDYSF